MSRSTSILTGSLLLTAALVTAPAAPAGLGEGTASIARDHAALHGHALQITPMQSYDRHELTTASGTKVREYASRDGTVFAVAFAGPSVPDLKVLLGARYDEYARAVAARAGNHHVLSINSPGLVMQVIKLPRGLIGRAHVPALLPAGVSPGDLR